jgi:hypothetical protein
MATLTNAQLQFYSARHIERVFWAVGDSYVGGAGGASLAIGLRNQGLTVISSAVGGSTMADIRDQIFADLPLIRRCTALVVWDGSANGYVDAVSYADLLEAALDAAGVPFVVLPSAVPFGQVSTIAGPIRDEFVARWGSSVHDWRGSIANTAGVINENRMLNYPADNVHLNQTAHNEAAAAIAALLP